MLDAAIAEFLTALRAGKPSPHTIRGYASDLAVVRGLLAEDPATLTIEDLGVARLRAGFAAFADTHARASVPRAWAVWIQLFAHLLAGGVITGNPMGAVPKPKAARGAPAAFTDTDLSALIATLKDGDIPARRPWTARDYALVTTLALTGLRRAELLALAVDDVEGSPRERQLAVRHGKGYNYRAIPIQPALEHLIEHYLRERWGPVPDQRPTLPHQPVVSPGPHPAVGRRPGPGNDHLATGSPGATRVPGGRDQLPPTPRSAGPRERHG